jgi:hypothetical protein
MLNTIRRCTFAAALLAIALPQAAGAQPLTLGDQYTLRAHVGQSMGTAWTRHLGFSGVGVLTNDSSICASLVGATEAAFLSGGGARVETRAVSQPEAAAQAVEDLAALPTLALIFGGQTPAEANHTAVRTALAHAASNNYAGALFLHARLWSMKTLERAAAENAGIAAYLAGKSDLYTVTIDRDAGTLRVHRIALRDGRQQIAETLGEAPLDEPLIALLKRLS